MLDRRSSPGVRCRGVMADNCGTRPRWTKPDWGLVGGFQQPKIGTQRDSHCWVMTLGHFGAAPLHFRDFCWVQLTRFDGRGNHDFYSQKPSFKAMTTWIYDQHKPRSMTASALANSHISCSQDVVTFLRCVWTHPTVQGLQTRSVDF